MSTMIAEDKQVWPFVAMLALYFTAQTVQRTLLGGAFEVDEAEMFVMGQEFRLGYGPQLPLYNWIQAAAFAVFGANAFAVTVVKNLLLFATYLSVYMGLTRVTHPRLAAAVALSLFLLPNLSWEGQRAGSHTIAMLAVIGASFWTLIALTQERRIGRYVVLGLLLGAGGITKYNFWIFPLSLAVVAVWEPALRRVVADRRILLSLGIAGLIVAGPYVWLATNLTKGLSSTRKFYDAAAAGWPTGLGQLAIVSLAACGTLLLVLLAVRLGARASFWRLGAPPALSRWMLAGAALSAGVAVIAVIAGDVARVQPRWLLPVYIQLAIGLSLWVLAGVSGRAQRNYLRFCGVMAVVVLAAMADIRLRGAGSDSLQVEVLAEALQGEVQAGTTPTVVTNFYYGGNLKYHRPGWQIVPPITGYAIGSAITEVLVVFRKTSTDPQSFHAIAALDRPYRVLRRGTVDVPYRFEGDKTLGVNYAVLAIAAAQ